MSAAVGTYRLFRPDPAALDRREHHHRGWFSASHRPGSRVVVTVEGEVDVDFFGTAGYVALHNINVICSR